MTKYPPEYYDMEAPIRRFVTKSLVGIEKNKTVQEAAQRMVQFDISSLIVLDEDSEEIVGFFTDGDITKKVTAEGIKPDILVEEVMSTDLITIGIGKTIKDATRAMTKQRIKHILVEEGGDIVGILSFADVIGMERRKLETYISRE